MANGDGEEVAAEWFAGVFIGIGATLAATLSKIYMKKAHMVEDENEVFIWLSSSNMYLLIGILLLVVNTPMNFAAFALAPQSVVAATAGTASLFNMILAPWLIEETRTRWDEIGGALICLGCVGASVFGSHATPAYTYRQLEDMFTEPEFWWFSLGVAIYLSTLAYLMRNSEPVGARADWPVLRKLAWGMVGGSVGGIYIFLKTTLMMIREEGGDAFTKWPTYLVLIGTGLTAGGGIVLLNEALKRYNAMFIAPLYQAGLVVMGGISGAVFFKELNGLGTARVVVWAISIVIICFGSMSSLMAESTAEEEGPAAAVEMRSDPLGDAGNKLAGVMPSVMPGNGSTIENHVTSVPPELAAACTEGDMAGMADERERLTPKSTPELRGKAGTEAQEESACCV